MTTIEERAESYALKRDEFGYVDIPDVEVMSDKECEDYLRETYIEIATEQEEITKREMIARTCEWMKNHNVGEEVIEQYVKDMEE